MQNWQSYRYGLKEYGGIKFLVQPEGAQNALGVKLDHPFKRSNILCPHNFVVPAADLDLPPIATKDPLFRAMLPGTSPGVYLMQGNVEVVTKLAAMYNSHNAIIYQGWELPADATLRSMALRTNVVPLIFVNVNMLAIRAIARMLQETRNIGRRVIISCDTRPPALPGGEFIKPRLDHFNIPRAEELVRIGNAAITREMLS